MQWSDDGVVLGVRRHGETAVILELMTRAHGRHLGLVHGGRSRKQQPVLQVGNTVRAVWRARLDENLGAFRVEGATMRAGRFIGSAVALYGLAAAAALLRFLPERDSHPALFETLTVLVSHLHDEEIAPALFVRFELGLLAELGFGLDLSSCAVTGRINDLAFVSPGSGRAVSAAAGELYRDRLLRLPGFLTDHSAGGPPSQEDVRHGFALTGAFLDRCVFEPRGVAAPEERTRFMALAVRSVQSAPTRP